MTAKIEDVTEKVNRLSRLLENAQNKKILWEEMKILSSTAFQLQDEIMELLNELETTQQDITKIQSVFDTREIVWDLMSKIAARETEVKEKATKNHKNAHEKTPAHPCGCSHTHEGGCCCDHEKCSHDEHDHHKCCHTKH